MAIKPQCFELKNKSLKKLSIKLIEAVEGEVKALLHAARDTMRNHKINTLEVSFNVNTSYYAEAFGLMRGLAIQRYGYFGPDNLNAFKDSRGKARCVTHSKQNLKWWFNNLCKEVLKEENFNGDNHCDYCLEKYHKDGVRKR